MLNFPSYSAGEKTIFINHNEKKKNLKMALRCSRCKYHKHVASWNWWITASHGRPRPTWQTLDSDGAEPPAAPGLVEELRSWRHQKGSSLHCRDACNSHLWCSAVWSGWKHFTSGGRSDLLPLLLDLAALEKISVQIEGETLLWVWGVVRKLRHCLLSNEWL